jgi:hypothetical protein
MSHWPWPPCLWGTRRPVAVWRLWSGPNFHTDAALGFRMVSAGTPIAHARGTAGRGLVDAGTRLSGACAVRLEWARMAVSVVCAGRIGRIEKQAAVLRAIWQAPGFGSPEGSGRPDGPERTTSCRALARCLLGGAAHRRAGNRCGAAALVGRPLDPGETCSPGLSCDAARRLPSTARGFAVGL